jgi:hypothetical protein
VTVRSQTATRGHYEARFGAVKLLAPWFRSASRTRSTRGCSAWCAQTADADAQYRRYVERQPFAALQWAVLDRVADTLGYERPRALGRGAR